MIYLLNYLWVNHIGDYDENWLIDWVNIFNLLAQPPKAFISSLSTYIINLSTLWYPTLVGSFWVSQQMLRHPNVSSTSLWWTHHLARAKSICGSPKHIYTLSICGSAKELTEIYSTPTPNAMAKAEKIILIECSSLFIITRVNIYTRNLNMNPTQLRLAIILGMKENFLT